MTGLVSAGVFILFFIVPYLTGNIYSLFFRKKTMGIVSNYLSGVAILYAVLFVVQIVSVKLKFNFSEVIKVYNLLFGVLIIVGGLCFAWKLLREKSVLFDITCKKKSIWVAGIIALQGVLYIVLKNPYFENNALLETTRTILETGTIYEYNAFNGMEAVAGFPLSNKLMFLPVYYAYLSLLFGVNPAILFNFIIPAVTFISFYLIMSLWVQKLSNEHGFDKTMLLVFLVWIVQVADGWEHSTAFRVLHSGYTGEAIFFGVIFMYALHSIKNKCYFITIICAATFPGLVKYDAIIDFIKGFGQYRNEAMLCGGILAIYFIGAGYYLVTYKRMKAFLLNPYLTICLLWGEMRNKLVESGVPKWKKDIGKVVLPLLLLMCGNLMVVSDGTQWRTNVYGVTQAEYEVLETIEVDNGGPELYLMADDELLKWVRRLGLKMTPVVGYDLGGTDIKWYSYEKYEEKQMKLWEDINYPPVNMEDELVKLKEDIPMDYLVLRRITTQLPITDNESFKCVYESPSYVVYSVDKK